MLYVLRHAEAELGFPDELRRLTQKGNEQSQVLGKFFKKQKSPTPDVIWHSGLERAEATALKFLEGFQDEIPLERLDFLKPSGSAAILIQKLKTQSKSILLVSHNPLLTDFINELLSFGAHQEAAHVRKASLWAFTPIVDSDSGKCWQLEWSICADQLIRLGSL